ncbi:MAG: hypothetical protein Q7R81_05245 [Candidatus Peregrinibacteria bacterium]|nr:hypothetical protein [Candidatus Peregrinibacteria bacterium]
MKKFLLYSASFFILSGCQQPVTPSVPQSSSSSASITVSSSESSEPQRMVYTNTSDGFQLSYPPDLILTRLTNVQVNDRGANFGPNQLTGSQLAFPDSDISGTNLISASINIATVPCVATEEGTTVTNNGISWKFWESGDAAMGVSLHVVTYQTRRHSMCYYLALSTMLHNMDRYEDPATRPKEYDKHKFDAILQEVVQSFQFTK